VGAAASFLSLHDLLVFARVGRRYHRVVMSMNNGLWRTVDLRGVNIQLPEFISLMTRVGRSIRTLHLIAVDKRAWRVTKGVAIEALHPTVQWLLEHKEAVPQLQSLSVMDDLSWESTQRLLHQGITTIHCANNGVHPEMPATTDEGSAGAGRCVRFNGLVADTSPKKEEAVPVQPFWALDVAAGGLRWTPATMCSATPHQRCQEMPALPWRRSTCQWCHAANCLRCRRVNHRSYLLPSRAKLAPVRVALWVCAACEERAFSRPCGWRDVWGATLVLKG